tara:strand:- start:23768 stop:24718 length:951 start_codon:yes stop_codon:yes gene_type:complete
LKKVFIAGQNGMVGSSLARSLSKDKSIELLNASSKELDLVDQQKVSIFFKENEIDEVYIAAAKVGGIYANNTYPADFIYNNIMITSNILHSCYKSKVTKVLYLGSSCIYPKHSNQPISEKMLLSGKLEETNEPYAIAKIAGIKMCESYNRQHNTDFRSVMPCNLYGEGDNYHAKDSHVIPALIRRFHEAKINEDKFVDVWGSGEPRREFLYVDDLASACVHVMNLDRNNYQNLTSPMCSHINIGNGVDISIKDLSYLIKKIIGYRGEIKFDTSMPDGTMKKLIDSNLIKGSGWMPRISIESGINLAYRHFMLSDRK